MSIQRIIDPFQLSSSFLNTDLISGNRVEFKSAKFHSFHFKRQGATDSQARSFEIFHHL